MLSVFHQLPPSSPKRSVSFAPEVDSKEEESAIREDMKKARRLPLQSDVAFVTDKYYALKLFQEAQVIIEQRSFIDEDTQLMVSSRRNVFEMYGYEL